VTAMKAGVSRRIELSFAASLSTTRTNDAAFLYEIDLDALDAIGSAAVDSALAGDLTKLNALEGDAPSHGVTTLATSLPVPRRPLLTSSSEIAAPVMELRVDSRCRVAPGAASRRYVV